MDSNELKKQYEAKIAKELQELAEYRKALEAEFRTKTLDDPETALKAKAEVVSLVPDAVSQLKWLILHADSESIRKDISKWVMELAIKAADKNGEDDELKDLLKQFSKTPVNDT